MTRWAGPCTFYDAEKGYCGAKPTRRYLQGRFCRQHTPAALAGQPEPGATATPWTPRWASTLPPRHDTRGHTAHERPRPHDGEDD